MNLAARDAYLSNGDDSGTLKFRYTNPVLGLRWLVAPGLNIHASAARGFESPTLGELAYRPSGAAGLNDALKAQKSTQMEVGAKWRAEGVQADLSIFESHITDEIGVATNAGGRATFQNIGRTLRRGAELAAAWRPAAGWRTAVSATWLDASNRDGFLTCVAIPCTVATLKIPAGNRIAGTQRGNLWAELAWGEWGFETRAVARTAVNDSNTDYAPRYSTSALRWTHRFVLGESTQLELLARVDNLFDRRYAGSVIVNDGNGRYFETGAPRSALLALRLIGKP